MKEAIHTASHAGDTLGGIFEVVASGVVPGLGSHVQWDRKLDGRLAQALMSIQAIKGVGNGLGFGAARTSGSNVARPDRLRRRRPAASIGPRTTQAASRAASRTACLSCCRAAMKPIATLKKALGSVDDAHDRRAYAAAFEPKRRVRRPPPRASSARPWCAFPGGRRHREIRQRFAPRALLRNVDGYRAQLAEY